MRGIPARSFYCNARPGKNAGRTYHDPSRYWFFLPHESSGRWLFDDRVLNCAPYQTLRKPRKNNILTIAPLSSHAIVVSQDGGKQDNAAHTAIQQVVNGFVPCALEWAFSYNINYTNVLDPDDEYEFEPGVDALIPVVVTNASLFRLKPEIKDLDLIRKASGPLRWQPTSAGHGATTTCQCAWGSKIHEPLKGISDGTQNWCIVSRTLKTPCTTTFIGPTGSQW